MRNAANAQRSLRTIVGGAAFFAASVFCGCKSHRCQKPTVSESVRYVLRWEGLGGVSANTDKKPVWSWHYSEITSADGRQAVEAWIGENCEALSAPKRIVPLTVRSTGHLFRFSGEGSCTEWPIWLHMPSGERLARLSKAELLRRVWTENLAVRQYERLKHLFRVYGRESQPIEARPHACSERKSTSLVPNWGTFILRVRSQQGTDAATKWTSLAISEEPGHEAVRQWILANYEALKCAKAMSPHLAVLRQRQLHWFDERGHAWVDLLVQIPIGQSEEAREAQCVEVLPTYEVEYLTRLFRQYGVVMTFEPEQLYSELGPLWLSGVDLFAPQSAERGGAASLGP